MFTIALPNSTVTDCAKLMNQNHVGCIPVCDEGKNLVGLVTDRDITLRCIASNKDCNTTKVSDIMTCNVILVLQMMIYKQLKTKWLKIK